MAKEKRLEEINMKAAFNISVALSKLFHEPVEVKVARTTIVKSLMPMPNFNFNSIVAGVYLPLSGDINGAVLLAFLEENAFVLSGLLLKKEFGAAKELDELAKSALSEVGNIITGNYFTVVANELNAKIIEHIPRFSIQKFSQLLKEVIAGFTQEYELVLGIEMELIFAPQRLPAYLLFLLESGKIVERLKP